MSNQRTADLLHQVNLLNERVNSLIKALRAAAHDGMLLMVKARLDHKDWVAESDAWAEKIREQLTLVETSSTIDDY